MVCQDFNSCKDSLTLKKVHDVDGLFFQLGFLKQRLSDPLKNGQVSVKLMVMTLQVEWKR